MLVHAIIIQVETPLILIWVLAPRAVNQTQPVAAIARRREPPQLLLVPLIARPAGLPRQIIARPAIVHLQQLDIARQGRTQELIAAPGRPQDLSAPPGQQAAHSNVRRWIWATWINLVVLL
jgi:hypothetical protein